MDFLSIVGIITFVGVLIGIIASVAQIFDFLEKRRSKKTPISVDTVKRESISNLPARGQFIGRENEITRVLDGLKSNYPFIVITGSEGIGKTALAKEVAWRVRNNFESIVWVEFQGGQLTLNELLNVVARVNGEFNLIQLDLIDRRLEILKYLHKKSCLIVVDDFTTGLDHEVIDFLRKIPAPTSMAIITTKTQDILIGGWLVSLGKMSYNDTLSFVRSELNRLGVRPLEDSEIKKLCEVVDGDPYTIPIKVGQIHGGVSLQTVLGSAVSDEKRLNPSWERLDTVAQKVLMTVAIFQSPRHIGDIELVSKVSGDNLHKMLKHLSDLNLISVSRDNSLDRYSILPRTRAFVLGKFENNLEQSHMLIEQLANWLENYVAKYGGTKNWSNYPLLDQEASNIFRVVEWCSLQKPEEKRRALKIWRAVDHYFSVKGDLYKYLKISSLALECARSCQDPVSENKIKVEALGWAFLTQGHLDRAESLISEGTNFYLEYGDLVGVGRAKWYLGRIAQRRADFEPTKKDYYVDLARHYFEEALDYLEKAGGVSILDSVLSSLGILYLQSDEVAKSRDFQSRRLSLSQAVKNPEGIAVALYNLGRISQIEGKSESALSFYSQSLTAAMHSSRGDVLAASQLRSAQIFFAKGDIAQAEHMAKMARESYEAIGTVNSDVDSIISNIDEAKTEFLRYFLLARLKYFIPRFWKRKKE